MIPKTKKYTQQEWYVVPEKDSAHRFHLKTARGGVICVLAFPERGSTNTTLLNLIAAAPELQDIAEMYRDTMVGSKTEGTMAFGIVSEVLNRIK